ncbi:MAG TPA: hypothetical protein VFP55_03660 [Solirubrobacteraceae bacterium]|nr:hypothetical protein [Solirubrobacteraceae bacterium]
MIILLFIVMVTAVLPLLALALLAGILLGLFGVVRSTAESLRVRREGRLLAIAADQPVVT